MARVSLPRRALTYLAVVAALRLRPRCCRQLGDVPLAAYSLEPRELPHALVLPLDCCKAYRVQSGTMWLAACSLEAPGWSLALQPAV